MPYYQTRALWALPKSGSQNFIVVAPLLLKRRRDFYKGCRNQTGITKMCQTESVRITHLNHWIYLIVVGFVAFWACCLIVRS